MEHIVAYTVLCGIIAAKWAMELGFSQVRQVLFGLGGLLFGPLTLLVLYVYALNAAKQEGKPGAKWM